MGSFPGFGGSALPLLRRAVLLGVLAVVAVSALPGQASAAQASAAAAPCWKSVTLDWAADGVVNQTYPIPCYQQAINHLQPDQQLYSSAADDIRRALQRAIADKNNPNSTTSDPQPDTKTDGGGGVPVALLVLGGLAIALVAVGAFGLFRRRGRDAT